VLLGVVLRNNSVESLVLADRVAVPCLVIDFLDDVKCFFSSQMLFFVWYAVYRVCVCVWCALYRVCVCVVCTISCVCGVHYIVCVCVCVVCSISFGCGVHYTMYVCVVCSISYVWFAVYRMCLCVCVWCAVYRVCVYVVCNIYFPVYFALNYASPAVDLHRSQHVVTSCNYLRYNKFCYVDWNTEL
jgi:hypothetical protein